MSSGKGGKKEKHRTLAQVRNRGYGGRTEMIRAGISVEPSPTQNAAAVVNSTVLRGHSYPFRKARSDPSVQIRQVDPVRVSTGRRHEQRRGNRREKLW